jgi:tetratricopeptide (TPR) repeat protein
VRSRLDNEKNFVELLKSGSIVNCRYRARSWKRENRWRPRRTFIVVAAFMSVSALLAVSQNSSSARVGGLTIQGEVLDSSARPVVGASVLLQQKGGAGTVETTTDSAGAFGFSGLPSGIYTLLAQESDLRSRADVVLSGLGGDRKNIQLVLEPGGPARPTSHIATPTSADSMEFSDAPSFTIAGVTDWTAVGGHGSDSTLRTSEVLARETLTLKPDSSEQGTPVVPVKPSDSNESESKLRANLATDPKSFEANHQLGEFYFHEGRYRESIPLLQTAYHIDPANWGNEYYLALDYQRTGDFSEARKHAEALAAHQGKAESHALLAELEEELGDPLAAVHEYEQAARVDPTEQNYFAWGSELLLHRAVWQAQEVFRQGTKAYPKSARMLAALGTALFAGDLYDEAAVSLCAASDLKPEDAEPYIFLGRIETAAPTPLPCVEARLARFAREHPENALANYFYAMAIWKQQGQPAGDSALQQIEALLKRSITIDPKCADAYLQLGILYFSQHQFDRAIASYKKAVEANPELGEAHYRLGVAYDRVGDSAEAKEEFQLHDEIEKRQSAVIEQQRREVKQFLVVQKEKAKGP